MKKILFAGILGLYITLSALSVHSAEVTLRLHQFLPLKAAIPAHTLQPWIEEIQEKSGGRILVEHYPSMQLGGKPPELYAQVRDGVVDVVWTVLGYTPGLFPVAEAFELPFMTGDAASGSIAFHRYMMAQGQENFKAVHPLAFHVHGPGILHVKGNAIKSLQDMKGKKMRGPTRVVTNLLTELGATAVGMPVPAVPESLSKGVIDGAALPYEVTIPLKISELTDAHTGFSSQPGLYTATFGILMNKARYDSLPDDLKSVLNAASGEKLARLAGQTMDRFDGIGLKIAKDAGNDVVMLDDVAKAKWLTAAQPIIDNWASEMDKKGFDGADLIKKARTSIASAN